MYLCKVCGRCSRPGQHRLVHVVHRTVKDRVTGLLRQEIAREVPVCEGCDAALRQGRSLNGLARQRDSERNGAASEPAPLAVEVKPPQLKRVAL